jgi:hypothetical protein
MRVSREKFAPPPPPYVIFYYITDYTHIYFFSQGINLVVIYFYVTMRFFAYFFVLQVFIGVYENGKN